MASVKNSNPRITDLLLAKYAIGEAAAGESLLVEQWMEADENNRKQFEGLLLIINEYKPGTDTGLKDEDAAWQQLKERIANSRLAPVRSINNWWKWSAAAMLALLIGVAVVLKTNIIDNTRQPVALSPLVGDGHRQDSLPDGSVVLLERNATLSYNAGFGAAQRNIQLKGGCFFLIAHDPSRPFRISVNDITVIVIGTSFTIKSDTLHTSVKVHTGIVEVKKMENIIRLVKGDSINILPRDTILKKIVADSIPFPLKQLPVTQNKNQTGMDDREKQKQSIKNILTDIVLMGIESEKDKVEWFGLNDSVFVVNGKKQPASVQKKMSKKYAVKKDYGFYYGPVQITGKGVFMNKEEIN